MACRRCKESYAMLNRTALGIGCAKIKSADTRKRHRRRAHSAGLQRHIQIAVGQPLAAERCRGCTNGDELGVRGGVAINNRTIAGPSDHLAVSDNGTADRNLAAYSRGASLLNGNGHK